MFDRNRVDSGAQQSVSVPVEIEIEADVVLKGRLIYSAARSFADVLNGGGQFLEFEPYGEPKRYLSKTVIRALKVVAVPVAGQLDARKRDGDGFDPHVVLGVTTSTPWDEVRHAYLTLSKAYHPDKFQAVDLPAEVRDYLSAMASRVNIAYAALERVVISEKSRVSTRVEPIYESRPRA